ncbi:tRNA-uridine aminocarboxypropyltransferase [Thalassotalea euphylliae]|uniref:tRNA-uridine aminocarboxypropyltransferase n=1 Tax=Thalassotalea euphylliae TaxID=1655234 RepID=A0A3E0UH14_9GAMM|nr:tRNA-uridine aminocarboxypropyltransferase [Thalassotalea euphylliae]REL36146.1 DTW domain-containing protein [Thalassotalea euphylliae]
MNHSVQQLYRYRKGISTKPFNARGKKVVRCEYCQLASDNCICHLRQPSLASAHFAIIMHDAEVLKPSNTARLIADVVPNTSAFIWSRTEPNTQLLALLTDPRYQPYVIFPEQYAVVPRQVYLNQVPKVAGEGINEQKVGKQKTPLFVLLDGSWREAKKMFRKSPYLDNFPVVSVSAGADLLKNESNQAENLSANYIREAEVENQFSTAQVAAQLLALNGDDQASEHLSLWFDLFNFQYQKSVCQPNLGRADALERYQVFINNSKPQPN